MMNFIRTYVILFLFFLSYNLLYSNRLKLGIDVLLEQDFDIVKNKKILLLTNYTGRNSEGILTVEILKANLKENILGLLTPEHGFFSAIPAGKSVPNDTLFGLPVYSLYGNIKMPNKKILTDCDAIIIDIQDIGIRSYTYISTIIKTLETAIDNNIEVIILDRPNPLGGEIVDGNVVEKEYESFVSCLPIPYIHGCTIAELAFIANEEGWINKNKKANLRIVKMKNWYRWMVWEDTKLSWYPTSPNIPTIDAVRGAATLGAFGELGIFSIGIGTSLPFQYIGSPYFDYEKILNNIDITKLKGLKLIPIQYYPFFGMYKDKICNGFLLKFEPDNNFKPYTFGFFIALAIKKVYPEVFNEKRISENAKNMFIKVTGNNLIFNYLFDSNSYEKKLVKILNKGLNEFLSLRKKYLLYD